MSPEALLCRHVVLPTHTNDGRPLTQQIAMVTAEIMALCGGVSTHEQRGAWHDPATDTVHVDRALHAYTLLDAEADRRLVARLPQWCAWLEQECLLSWAEPVRALFVARAPTSAPADAPVTAVSTATAAREGVA